MTPRGDEWKTRARWVVGGAIVAALVACGWPVLMDTPAYQFPTRLYVDKRFLKQNDSDSDRTRAHAVARGAEGGRGQRCDEPARGFACSRSAVWLAKR